MGSISKNNFNKFNKFDTNKHMTNVKSIILFLISKRTCHVYRPFEFRTSLGTSILLLKVWIDRNSSYSVLWQILYAKISKYKKRLLVRCVHHFKSDLINNMDHIRISLTEPSSVILSKECSDKATTQNVAKTTITQRLRTNLRRWVGVTTATTLLLLNRLGPADKTANNVIIIWKRYYTWMFWRRIWILRVHMYLLSWRKTNFFCVISILSLSQISKLINLTCIQFYFHFYWLPKLHKNPYKSRFISNSSHCSTTILSKHITSQQSKAML